MLWPRRGLRIDGNDLVLDIYGKDDGYIFAASRSSFKSKLMIEKDNHRLPFDLRGNGRYDLIPLSMGDGVYKVTLYRNVTGNQYKPMDTKWITVKLHRPDACFYIPNQYVEYTEDSEVVEIANSLWKETDEEYFKNVKQYIKKNYGYDFIKAVTRKKTILPDIEGTIKSRLGICQDLAALVVALLRLHDIKSKLVIGYADGKYHAWTLNTIGDKEILFDPTFEINAIGKVKNYRNERIY